MAYPRKEEAVRELKRNFIEDEDYIFRKNAEKLKTKQLGRTKIEYFLSVACLEYFIAKRVKPVFDVYRQVFHKAIENPKKAIPGSMPYKEGEVFVAQLGDIMTHSVFIEGDLYSRLTPIACYIGYRSGLSKDYRNRISKENLKLIYIGQKPNWMVNLSGFNEILEFTKMAISYQDMKDIKFGLFGSALEQHQDKLFRFTQLEILNIIHCINASPIKKSLVIDLLLKGGQLW